MTEAQAREKSFEKIQKIQDLAKELNVSIIAQQIVDKGHVVQNKVCYIDQEEYTIDKVEPVVRGPIETPVHISKLEKQNEAPDLPK